MQTFTRILFLFIVFLVAVSCFDSFSYAETPQPCTSSSKLIQNVDPNETILKFEQFLRAETKEHRESLESIYLKIRDWTISLAVVISVIFGWLSWKSKKEITAQLNEQFKKNVDPIIALKLAENDRKIKESIQKAEEQFVALNRYLLELTTKLDSHALIINGAFSLNGLSGKKILWVDDEPANNAFPKQLLEKAGVTFITTLSTDEALKCLEEDKFNLIISDMRRGENKIAGLELLKKLKEISNTTPVIIYTSSKAISHYGEAACKFGAKKAVTGETVLVREVMNIFSEKKG